MDYRTLAQEGKEMIRTVKVEFRIQSWELVLTMVNAEGEMLEGDLTGGCGGDSMAGGGSEEKRESRRVGCVEGWESRDWNFVARVGRWRVGAWGLRWVEFADWRGDIL